MRKYLEGAWQREMKLHVMILRAMGKDITRWPAVEITGITDRACDAGVRAGGDSATTGCSINGGRPEIFNSDQGSPFPSERFTGELEPLSMTISMDGQGR